jgi:ATP-dependent RNA helicase RhlE
MMTVEVKQKPTVLMNILKDKNVSRALVFTRTKHGANKLAKLLGRADIGAQAIHGNKSQTARQKALDDFKEGRCRVLVATDLAARGIDVEDISHVINYDIPNISETYVHRIGRTARAGCRGISISLCSPEEAEFIRDIEKLIKQPIPMVSAQSYMAHVELKPAEKPARRPVKRSAGRPAERSAGRPAQRSDGRAGRSSSRPRARRKPRQDRRPRSQHNQAQIGQQGQGGQEVKKQSPSQTQKSRKRRSSQSKKTRSFGYGTRSGRRRKR